MECFAVEDRVGSDETSATVLHTEISMRAAEWMFSFVRVFCVGEMSSGVLKWVSVGEMSGVLECVSVVGETLSGVLKWVWVSVKCRLVCWSVYRLLVKCRLVCQSEYQLVKCMVWWSVYRLLVKFYLVRSNILPSLVNCYQIQGVTGGTDQTSGECSLGQTIPTLPKTHTYIQSWAVTEILAREKSGLLWCLRTVLVGVVILPLLELNSYVIVRCSASDLDNGPASKSV